MMTAGVHVCSGCLIFRALDEHVWLRHMTRKELCTRRLLRIASGQWTHEPLVSRSLRQLPPSFKLSFSTLRLHMFGRSLLGMACWHAMLRGARQRALAGAAHYDHAAITFEKLDRRQNLPRTSSPASLR